MQVFKEHEYVPFPIFQPLKSETCVQYIPLHVPFYVVHISSLHMEQSSIETLNKPSSIHLQRRVIHLNPQSLLEIDFDITSIEEKQRREQRKKRFANDTIQSSNLHKLNDTDTIAQDDTITKTDDIDINGTVSTGDTLNELQYLIATSNELKDLPDYELQQELLAFEPQNTRRYDTIHLIGTSLLENSFSTDDIFRTIFYSMPCHSVEWISDYRCNVHFNTVHDCRRAIHTLSLPPSKKNISIISSTFTNSIDSIDDLEFFLWRQIPLQQFSLSS